MQTTKRKTLRKRAEVIVHPVHKGDIPIPLGKGEGPSKSEVRVAKLRAELDLTPKALPPLPTVRGSRGS